MKPAENLLKQGPSVQHLLVLALLIGVVFPIYVQEKTSHPSIWLQLRTGQYIAETRSIPRRDPFSEMSGGRRWVDSQWLSEVLLYSVHAHSGYKGLMILVDLLGSATCLVVLATAHCLTQRLDVALACATWAVWGLSSWMVPRAHLWSYLFLALLLYVLVSARHPEKARSLWLAPIVLALWCNFDVWCSLGLGILLLYWLALEFQCRPRRPAPDSLELRAFRWVCPVAFLACLVNPNGYAVLVVPMEQFLSPLRSAILEWHPPNLQVPAEAVPLTFAVVVLIGGLGLSSAARHPGDVCLALLGVWAAMGARQYLPLFVIAVVPLASVILGRLFDGMQASAARLPLMRPNSESAFCHLNRAISQFFRERARVYWAPLVALFISSLSYAQDVVVPDTTSRYPVRAAEFLASQPARGRLFSPDLWSGYLIYRLWPKYRAFVDDRFMLLYEEKTVRDYFRIVSAAPGWEALLDRYEIDLLVLSSRERQLQEGIRKRADWRQIYRDSTTTIFERADKMPTRPRSNKG